MKYKSAMMTQASGSVGGMTASRNRGGNYMRARAIPTNPKTAEQMAVRNSMSSLSGIWANTLTAAQRAAWETYAANVPLINALGDQITVTGLNMFIRSNVPLLQAGLSRVDDGPTTFNTGSLSQTSIDTANATLPQLAIAYDNTDEWANETGGHLFVYSGISVAPSINYFTGPYRYVGKEDGDGTTAPTSPVGFSVIPYTLVANNKVFVRVRAITADGRLTPVQELSAVVA